MFLNILKSIFGSRNDRLLKKYKVFLKEVNEFEKSLSLLSDHDLKCKFSSLREQCSDNVNLDEFLPCVYAIVREVSYRVLKMRHYDVQILGGIVLYYCKVAEIATGEGKTLVATLPICLYSLMGKSVHVVTVNDYLAKRDADWMKPIYDFLDISVGVVLSGMSNNSRSDAYKSHVVYGTNSEFGFDYLRDNIVLHATEKVQGELFYAIVDEVDSILIDEARTPLIISMPEKLNTKSYILIDKIVRNLTVYDSNLKTGHFILDEKSKQVNLTDFGFSYLESFFKKVGLLDKSLNLYSIKNIELLHDIYAALKAHNFFKKDVDYILRDNNILIIDEHTGRIMDGRRWGDGIHQAIEVKERVPVKNENQTLASITFQNYFRLYKKLAGMTGTAYTESLEFNSIYGLEVIVIPTNKPNIRIDKSDLVFLTKKFKFKAVVEDIKACYTSGRPVLIGTVSIEVSESLSKILKGMKIKHNVLNAKYHFKESQIIAEAGRPYSVTIATNMAGRGTDIVLGSGSNNMPNLENYKSVVNLGGLKIIGTERHESRRIDNQLRGRSGRQGDPGCSQFYISLEDDLVRIFVGDKTKALLSKLNISESEVISHPLINKSIENAQCKVEGCNFDIRKQLLGFDDIVNEQRTVIYRYRDYLIFSSDISSMLSDLFKDIVDIFMKKFEPFDDKYYNVSEIIKSFNVEFDMPLDVDMEVADIDYFRILFFDNLFEKYKSKKIMLDGCDVDSFERVLFLNVLDIKWTAHLVNLDYLRKGIHLRGYAQKDPMQEYKREAFSLFEVMLESIKYEFILLFFKSSSKAVKDNSTSRIDVTNLDFQHNSSGGLSNDKVKGNVKTKPFVRKQPKIGRNDLCFCNSQKKYKQCHGRGNLL